MTEYLSILKRIEEILKKGIKNKNDNIVRKYNIHARFVDEEKTKAIFEITHKVPIIDPSTNMVSYEDTVVSYAEMNNHGDGYIREGPPIPYDPGSSTTEYPYVKTSPLIFIDQVYTGSLKDKVKVKTKCPAGQVSAECPAGQVSAECPVGQVSAECPADTDKNYKDQGLGTLVLIYGICFMKHPPKRYLYDIDNNQIPYPTNLMYAFLEDDSDKSTSNYNIYNNVGFEFVVKPDVKQVVKENKDGTTRIEDVLVPFGPEKQLLLDNTFITNINDRLDTKFPRTLAVGKKGATKKSSQLSLKLYNFRERRPKTKGGKKSNRKTKKCKRKTKKRRH
jgi:hypothetical protein